jgi:hypothetical protein
LERDLEDGVEDKAARREVRDDRGVLGSVSRAIIVGRGAKRLFERDGGMKEEKGNSRGFSPAVNKNPALPTIGTALISLIPSRM